MLFENSDFNWKELDSLFSFKKFYHENEIAELIIKVKNEYREKSLKFYNSVVFWKDDKKKLDDYLKNCGISFDEVTNYVLKNRFLYSKEKSALLNIVNKYYGNSLRVSDILELLDEMLDRELTLDEILKEKEIPKKEFYGIYYKVKEENLILYQCIFESLSHNKRKGFIKLMNFAYMIIESKISSLSEYREKFQDKIDFYELLLILKNTSLYESLLNKALTWNDFIFEQEIVPKKRVYSKIN